MARTTINKKLRKLVIAVFFLFFILMILIYLKISEKSIGKDITIINSTTGLTLNLSKSDPAELKRKASSEAALELYWYYKLIEKDIEESKYWYQIYIDRYDDEKLSTMDSVPE